MRAPTASNPSPTKLISITVMLVIIVLACLMQCFSGQKTPSATAQAIHVPPLPPWQFRACAIHRHLLDYQTDSGPEPMYSFLGLNGKASPFHPPSNSATKGSPQHRALRSTIIDSFQEKGEPLMDMVEKRRKRSGYVEPGQNIPHGAQSDEEARAQIMSQIVTFLLEDESRAHYARVFVTALDRSGWSMSSEKRLKSLKELCRW
ncbi:hypothetical protein BHE90_017359 [Fusarium euwallaceae]|uniref:Uncharacterized protein n=5 Tax=Fusarium solani species complex TaxID=232080 RepID=A0A3M2SRY1_9HYPO|nr:hypothetical protein CDV36_000139 [Fusarium kuroshium]RSL64390.1 hypothetical protein CEP51_013153 [Fusarium floridanum]RSL82622.1 hypothetical protein CEP52_016916 [Fusarium oligoseptatum]RSL91268.1 hypothetical protein CDV31_015498 [Fusarium ambrosium]RTE68264.1 hypothetical protein BHE90_017359 [Fusarium euwallaceae]